ncbi:hypothetical protein F2Q70_00039339 [Brassica cretica]|uniref:Uncharacterized protein n=1 Tax=Brassica cretica TaxID=69181 RepID=A0A8S9K2K2_BRACR|nr:hypothetical protein F2Q70_00039339 [Brassica cretica]
MLRVSIGELTRDLILGVIKSDLHFVWANSELRSWRMIGLLKVFWITQERIESSDSRKPMMLQKSLSLCGPRVEIIGTRDWKSGVLAKDLLGDQETTRRNRVGLLRHNCTNTVCSGIYGNREFPRYPSVDGLVMTGPRLVLDGGKVLLTGYGAVEPSVY